MTSARGQETFDAQLQRLYATFVAVPGTNEPAEKLADAILTLILRRARAQQGATYKRSLWGAIDEKTLSKMAAWDTNDPGLSTIEKVFKRLAGARGNDAITLLKASVEARRQAVSKSQREKAKKPRRPHPVVALIQTIVAENPCIDHNQLLHTLRRRCGGEVIDEIADGKIFAKNGRSLSVAGLKDQLSRAKKKQSR